MPESRLDRLIFGQRLRYLRRRKGLTLRELGARVGKPVPYLSMLENGRREPRILLVNALATALGQEPADLLAVDPPTERARLEIELARAQSDPLYSRLELPRLKPSTRLPDDVLKHLVTLYGELQRAEEPHPGEPGSAERALAALRQEVRDRDGYFPDIETLAGGVLSAVGYEGQGGIDDPMLVDIAAYLGFTVHRVRDLPGSVRSVTDLRHRRLYLRRGDRLDGAVLLETLAHAALGHAETNDPAERARQRIESKYFAGAILAPEQPAVAILEASRDSRELSFEDLTEPFALSYEFAARRLVSLATRHLGFAMHMLKTTGDGLIQEAYENDGIPLPGGPNGVPEGHSVCKRWAAHQAFGVRNSVNVSFQWTETPEGTFFCGTHIEPQHTVAITVGTTPPHARFFHGHNTSRRSVSRCPSEECCRRPSASLRSRWNGQGWALGEVAPRQAVEQAPDPDNVNEAEFYEFLERHAPAVNGTQPDS